MDFILILLNYFFDLTSLVARAEILKKMLPFWEEWCIHRIISVFTDLQLFQFKKKLTLWFLRLCQKRPKSDFQSQFSKSKQRNFFFKKNINLGDHVWIKTFFSNFKFWTPLFPKMTTKNEMPWKISLGISLHPQL